MDLVILTQEPWGFRYCEASREMVFWWRTTSSNVFGSYLAVHSMSCSAGRLRLVAGFHSVEDGGFGDHVYLFDAGKKTRRGAQSYVKEPHTMAVIGAHKHAHVVWDGWTTLHAVCQPFVANLMAVVPP